MAIGKRIMEKNWFGDSDKARAIKV